MLQGEGAFMFKIRLRISAKEIDWLWGLNLVKIGSMLSCANIGVLVCLVYTICVKGVIRGASVPKWLMQVLFI